jgi:predicted nucleotidyltransferase
MKTILTSEDVLQLIREQADHLKNRFAVRKIGLFGSMVRGEARPDSDLDVLVEFDVPSFDHYMDLKFYLEDIRTDIIKGT